MHKYILQHVTEGHTALNCLTAVSGLLALSEAAMCCSTSPRTFRGLHTTDTALCQTELTATHCMWLTKLYLGIIQLFLQLMQLVISDSRIK